jgi:hypothetical protein
LGEQMVKRLVTWLSYVNKEDELGLTLRISVSGKLFENSDAAIMQIDTMMRNNGFKPREEWRIVQKPFG